MKVAEDCGIKASQQSKLASDIGIKFEQFVLRGDNLSKLYKSSGILREQDVQKYPDMIIYPPGRPPSGMSDQGKMEWLQKEGRFRERALASMVLDGIGEKADDGGPRPIILGGAVSVNNLPNRFKPDAVVPWVTPDGLQGWRVAEIKSYMNRDGYTNEDKTGRSVYQIAMSSMGLRELLESKGHDPELISYEGDLIMASYHGHGYRLDTVDIRGEMERLYALVASQGDYRRNAQELGISPDNLKSHDRLKLLPGHYVHRCHDTCPMADVCTKIENKYDDPVVESMAAALREITPTLQAYGVELDRIVKILEGSSKPEDPAEEQVIKLIKDGAERV